MHQHWKRFTQESLQRSETLVLPSFGNTKTRRFHTKGAWWWTSGGASEACLPDSLRLCDGEVEQGRAGRLHAGVSGRGRAALPLQAAPAPRQEVHQQGRGVQREQHLPGTVLRRQVAQAWQQVPEETGRVAMTTAEHVD